MGCATGPSESELDTVPRWLWLPVVLSLKFRFFLCLFSGMSAGWKVFPLSHHFVLFCQPRTTQASLKDLRYTTLIQTKCTLLCIMLTVHWPTLEHNFQGGGGPAVSFFSFLFLVTWIKSHLQAVRDTHNQSIPDTLSFYLVPISVS